MLRQENPGFENILGYIVSSRPSVKKKLKVFFPKLGCASLAEHLPSACETLGFENKNGKEKTVCSGACL